MEVNSEEECDISAISKLSRGDLVEQLKAPRVHKKASAAEKNDEEPCSENSDDDGWSQGNGSDATPQPSHGSQSSRNPTGSG